MTLLMVLMVLMLILARDLLRSLAHNRLASSRIRAARVTDVASAASCPCQHPSIPFVCLSFNIASSRSSSHFQLHFRLIWAFSCDICILLIASSSVYLELLYNCHIAPQRPLYNKTLRLPRASVDNGTGLRYEALLGQHLSRWYVKDRSPLRSQHSLLARELPGLQLIQSQLPRLMSRRTLPPMAQALLRTSRS